MQYLNAHCQIYGIKKNWRILNHPFAPQQSNDIECGLYLCITSCCTIQMRLNEICRIGKMKIYLEGIEEHTHALKTSRCQALEKLMKLTKATF